VVKEYSLPPSGWNKGIEAGAKAKKTIHVKVTGPRVQDPPKKRCEDNNGFQK